MYTTAAHIGTPQQQVLPGVPADGSLADQMLRLIPPPHVPIHSSCSPVLPDPQLLTLYVADVADDVIIHQVLKDLVLLSLYSAHSKDCTADLMITSGVVSGNVWQCRLPLHCMQAGTSNSSGPRMSPLPSIQAGGAT